MRNALSDAPWLSAMALVFDKANAPLYLVGGAVRNPLMGLPISDVDVCGPLRPERVMEICEGTKVQAHMRMAHFGTLELFVTDENGKRHMAEYTTWRHDSYRCGHKPDQVEFTEDINVDALRRDLSINALYRRIHADLLEDVIDPTGGLEHLKKRILHTVSEDPDRVLGEDGLRILRVARFQGELDLQPTESLRVSLRKNAHLLKEIMPDRLRDEWQKIIMADLRYPELSEKRETAGTYAALQTLKQADAWNLLTDIPFDEAAARALARLRDKSFCARMALLLRNAEPAQARDALLRLHFSVKDAQTVEAYVRGMQAENADLPYLASLGRQALCFAAKAFDALADSSALERANNVLASLEGKPYSIREMNVKGDALIPLFQKANIPVCRMGALLKRLWTDVLKEEIPNETDALLSHAETLLSQGCI